MTYRYNYSAPSHYYEIWNGYSSEPSYAVRPKKIRQESLYSTNSPRENGKLKLQANYLTSYKHTHNVAPVFYDFTRYNGTHRGRQIIPVDLSPMTSMLSEGDATFQKCATRFWNELHTWDGNIAQMFAERRQTYNLIADTTRRLAYGYRELRRGRNPWRRGRRIRRQDASQVWLEYTYAWTPLVQDVHAIMELERIRPPAHIISKVASGGGQDTWSSDTVEDVAKVHRVRTEQYRDRVTIECGCLVKDPGISFLNQVGLTNPALLAWELLPYSFVVDWFIPIGDWLQMQTALVATELTSINYTMSRVVDIRDEFNWSTYSPYWGTVVAGHANRDGITRYKNRRVGSLPQIPGPKFKNPFSASHALSGLALLSQAFK